MRYLMAIIILAALGWSGWWWWNATTRERVIEDWLAERRAAGWVAEAADIRVTGFPNRIDTIVTGLELADPGGGWAWSAPEFQVLSLAYKPHHFIAVWPGEQVISSPLETLNLTGETLRGSVIFEPSLGMTLDRATIELGDLVLAGDGWEARLDEAVLAVRQAGEGGPEHAYEIAFDAEGLTLPVAIGTGGRGEVLPQTIDGARLDSVAEFDRAWDRSAVEAGGARIEGLRIRDLALGWGELDLRAQGELGVDAAGFAEGRVDLRARNWREMVELAERAGLLPSGLAGALRGGLDLIASLSGDRDSLEVPLDFVDGRARLGPMVIGPAPRLALR